jgi:hypothetical protein
MAGHMAPFRSNSGGGIRGFRRAGDDAFKITVDYLKQETLGPLQGLGRFLLWGVTGSLAIAIGIVLILVGILRVLQEETGTALTGNWSWVPYFAVSLIGAGVAGVAAWRITAGTEKPQKVPVNRNATVPSSSAVQSSSAVESSAAVPSSAALGTKEGNS